MSTPSPETPAPPPPPPSGPPKKWKPMAPAANATAIGWTHKRRRKGAPQSSSEQSGSESRRATTPQQRLGKEKAGEKRARDATVKRARDATVSSSEIPVDSMADGASGNEPHGKGDITGGSSWVEQNEIPQPIPVDVRVEPMEKSISQPTCTVQKSPYGQSDDDVVSVHWEGTHTAIVSIPGPTHVCLIGRATAAVVSGQIDVLGYRMSDPKQTVHIESPAWASAVTFDPVSPAIDSSPVEGRTLRISSLRPNGGPTFRVRHPWEAGVRPTVIPESWRVAVNGVLDGLLGHVDRKPDTKLGSLAEQPSVDIHHKARIMVCGAKNVGKSTCLRYLINRFLSDGVDKIALLDCDTGQPELSPPGMLTLTMVRNPLLSPPHSHMVMGSGSAGVKRHLESYFFGSTTSKMDPSRYLRYVKKLLARYTHLINVEYGGNESALPLLVNTDGWVKGLGLEILLALIDAISPGHVIQLQGEFRSKQFDLTPMLRERMTTVHMAHSYDNVSAMGSGPSSLTFQRSLDVRMAGPVASIPSHCYRSLRICTYFLGCSAVWDRVSFGQGGISDNECEIAHRLAAARPYRVPFDAVRCVIQGAGASQQLGSTDHIMSALNCSIVGLCCSGDTAGSGDTTGSRAPRVFDEGLDFSCAGLGLIRSVDRVQRVAYILTPIEPCDLEAVDLLVGGGIQIPSECLYRDVHAESFPFLETDGMSVGLGSDVMKSRNTLVRKGGRPNV